MALTDGQARWLVGGSLAASGLLIGYLLFRAPRAHGGSIHPGEDESPHHKKHHRVEEEDGEEHENARGEYGHKKHKRHHHKDAQVSGRPQQLLFPTSHEEGPGAPIWRLNDRINAFTTKLADSMGDPSVWDRVNPLWEAEVLPFLREWAPYWRDSTQWNWSGFDHWAKRWNALRARVLQTLPSAVRQEAWPV